MPTGAAGVIVSISGASTAQITTTKASGIASVVSSVVHDAKCSSDAASRPSPSAVAGFGGFVWVGLGAWAVGVDSLALFAVIGRAKGVGFVFSVISLCALGFGLGGMAIYLISYHNAEVAIHLPPWQRARDLSV